MHFILVGKKNQQSVGDTNAVNRMATGHRRTDTYYCQHFMFNLH